MAIRLYWSGGDRGEINFGDTISPLIVEMMSGKKVEYANINTCDIAAIGSLLNKIAAREWKRKLKLRFDKIRVWGTGAFGPDGLLEKRDRLAISAVRGKMTRDVLLLDSATPLGDPGLLIDRFGLKAEKNFRWGIIPHVIDREVKAIHDLHRGTDRSCIIDLADPDALATARKILSCDFIISSSLHGLITADAFGIPNVWMRVSENVFGGNWKFLDYFSTMGRMETDPLLPAEQPVVLRDLEATAARVPKALVEKHQKDLEGAFTKMAL